MSTNDKPAAIAPAGTSRSMWVWVAGGFLLLAVAWTALFTVAHSVKIESVPRTTKGGR